MVGTRGKMGLSQSICDCSDRLMCISPLFCWKSICQCLSFLKVCPLEIREWQLSQNRHFKASSPWIGVGKKQRQQQKPQMQQIESRIIPCEGGNQWVWDGWEMFSDSGKKGRCAAMVWRHDPYVSSLAQVLVTDLFSVTLWRSDYLQRGGGLTEAAAHACTPRREPLLVLETRLMDLRVLPLSGRRRRRQLRRLLWPHSGVEARRLALRVNPWRLLIWGDFGGGETHTEAVFVVKT